LNYLYKGIEFYKKRQQCTSFNVFENLLSHIGKWFGGKMDDFLEVIYGLTISGMEMLFCLGYL
jgi:hypothetical protein